jgi:hypothetical protein
MPSSPLLRIISILALSLLPFAATPSTQKRIRPVPQFTRGAALNYSIETRTTSNEHTTTPIVNSEGASQYKQSTSLVLRLDVLDVQRGRPRSEGSVRFRATFDQARADSEADAFAPEAAAIDDAIERLEGRSFEFAMDSENILSGVKGLDQIVASREVAARVLSWVRVLSAPVQLPRDGIEIGQKWSAERPLTDLPLTGVVWRNDSSYLRDESCTTSLATKNAAASSAVSGDCAILLTRFEILRHGSEHSDATPEEFRRNGLRTSGKWTGSGESLEAISLANGLLVSSAQNAKQEMDYEITSPSSGSRIHHVGQTTTQTEITLLPSGAR